MPIASEPIKISHTAPIAYGGRRGVFAYPGHPGLLIKVATPQHRSPALTAGKRLARRLFPATEFRTIVREVHCELLATLKQGSAVSDSPLARSFGVMQTDFGPGVIVECLSGIGGGLAPPLHDVVSGGQVSGKILDDLSLLADKLFALQIVAGDIHSRNIVYGVRDGKQAFFLIDGYGEKNLIPVRSMFRSLNNRYLHKSFTRVAAQCGLAWDKSSRRFTRA